MNIKNKIINIVLNTLEGIKIDEEINDLNLISDIGMDSLTFVELVVLLEESFDIEIPMEDLEINNFKDINSIAIIVEKLLKEKL